MYDTTTPEEIRALSEEVELAEAKAKLEVWVRNLSSYRKEDERKKPKEPKLCVKCNHYARAVYLQKSACFSPNNCTRSLENGDLYITNGAITVHQLRTSEDLCGAEAKWFQPRDEATETTETQQAALRRPTATTKPGFFHRLFGIYKE